MIIVKVVDRIIFGKNIAGITIWPFVFIKRGYDTPITINHESIHIKQQQELLVIPFYILYFAFYFINLFSKSNAYYSIPFERESYENEKNVNYLKERRPYSWTKYFFKKR